MSATKYIVSAILWQMKRSAGFEYTGISTVFYCVDGKGHLLMHKRSKNCRDEQGRWDTGSGQLQFGEDPAIGVLREVREEYGCEGKILEQLLPISVVREHKGMKTHWLAVPFIVKVNPKEVINNEPEKLDEIGWFTLENLPKPLHSAFLNHIIKTERLKILKRYLQV
jgi:ADP-ribose pyrophosphatase YjhB (NUDIX family)